LRPQQFFVARKALAGRSLQHAAPGATPQVEVTLSNGARAALGDQ
jgi:hypothetical protein